MSARNIDEVLVRLDAIIDDAIRRPSRLGLFAVLYRHTTARVKQGIVAGRFADGPRMDRFDTVFANRYLDAYAAWQAGRSCTRSWRVAFAAAEDASLICLQHLLLGMNAHINLDLGISAAEIAPGPALSGLRHDFDVINDILGELLGEMEDALARVSPLFHVIDRVCGADDEYLASFSIVQARAQAWRVACLLAGVPESLRPLLIDALDQQTAALGRLLVRPDPVTQGALAVVRQTEPSDVAAVVRSLRLAI